LIVAVTLFETGDGNTPLSPEEQADLIPDLTTKEELNEWERQNILEAFAWALNPRNLQRNNPLSETYIRDLHQRMFDQTWKWAGTYRTTEKNIGIPHFQIRESLSVLLGDARYWMEHQTFERDEIAIRFHHRLVAIHPFANGNGRHARLIADVVAQRMGRPVFTWGGTDIVQAGDFRRTYIDALRAAGRNDIQPLLTFART
jgi:Fic-DOC domain mobile mystery protein B